MLEGDYQTTFPTVGQYLIRNGRSWYSLEEGEWRSIEGYIKDLTQLEPLGILPCLLGLSRRSDYPAYRQACLKIYKQHQQSLMAQLELLRKRQHDVVELKSYPVIQLTPVLQIPFELLQYDKIADKLGKGSYGEVYRGVWQGKQEVAIKLLIGTLPIEAEENLYREAGIMAHLAKTLKEPFYIVRLFGLAIEKLSYAEKPNYALVMEYVPNGTLFDLLQKKVKLPWDLFYQIAEEIADAVELLHQHHIIHRDLRSHNVLLYIFDGRLRIKLSDFGLSTVKNSVRIKTGRDKMGGGTLAWMAPELHERSGKSSPASDIYSYGMILWECLTGKVPFVEAGNPNLISQWVMKGEQEVIPESCPPELAELIKKCWLFKPENRITMAEIKKELAILKRPYPFSSETKLIVDNLQKIQVEREEKRIKTSTTRGDTLPSISAMTISSFDEKESLSMPVWQNPQGFLPLPRRHTESLTESLTVDELKLQEELVDACEKGDAKAVMAALKKGARSHIKNIPGKQPLPAAMWSMNPEVVTLLIRAAEGRSPMTWEECRNHNIKWYKSVWVVDEFAPKTFEEWRNLLKVIDPYPLLKACHLKRADQVTGNYFKGDYENIKELASAKHNSSFSWFLGHVHEFIFGYYGKTARATESEYNDYRMKIKQIIEIASPLMLVNEKFHWTC